MRRSALPWERSNFLTPDPEEDDKAWRGNPLRTFVAIALGLFAGWALVLSLGWPLDEPSAVLAAAGGAAATGGWLPVDGGAGAAVLPDHAVMPLRIPRQLVLTAKAANLASLPPPVQRNIRRTLALSPGIRLRFLGDADCKAYIHAHFDSELQQIFAEEIRGSFRGDICRACVLAREGGFYLDLDVQLHVPLERLVDGNTTFAAAFTEDAAILNAIMAAAPENEVMVEALRQIRAWYRYEVSHEDAYTPSQWLGPVTMLRALREVARKACNANGRSLQRQTLQWDCGNHAFRLYEEHSLDCFSNTTEECPSTRAFSEFAGVKFGIFTPWPDHRVVAWPRFEECSDWGCSAGGWDETYA